MILNKSGKLVAWKSFFVTDIVKKEEQIHEFINSLLEKYRRLMIE